MDAIGSSLLDSDCVHHVLVDPGVLTSGGKLPIVTVSKKFCINVGIICVIEILENCNLVLNFVPSIGLDVIVRWNFPTSARNHLLLDPLYMLLVPCW